MVLLLAVGDLISSTRTDESDTDLVRTIIIAVCAAVAYLAVVIGLTVYCSLRLIKKKESKNRRNTNQDAEVATRQNGGEHTAELMTHANGVMTSSVVGGKSVLANDETRSHVSGVSSNRDSSSQRSSSMKSSNVLQKFAFPRCDLHMLGLLGKLLSSIDRNLSIAFETLTIYL